MPEPPTPPTEAQRPRRERSTRYPGVTLPDCIKFCASIQDLGVDGLSAVAIASALGYRNIKTNTFSAPLSASRQFGLLQLTGDGYALTPLARSILHPVDPTDLPRLNRQAFLKPPLYAELAERMRGKKVPEASILANVLYHHHDIIATAKQSAAEAFLESARFAGVLGPDQVLRPDAEPATAAGPSPVPPPPHDAPGSQAPDPSRGHVPRPRAGGDEVRLDLRLWGEDEGKQVRLRAPAAMTVESFERFLQAFRLLVRVESPSDSRTR